MIMTKVVLVELVKRIKCLALSNNLKRKLDIRAHLPCFVLNLKHEQVLQPRPSIHLFCVFTFFWFVCVCEVDGPSRNKDASRLTKNNKRFRAVYYLNRLRVCFINGFCSKCSLYIKPAHLRSTKHATASLL